MKKQTPTDIFGSFVSPVIDDARGRSKIDGGTLNLKPLPIRTFGAYCTKCCPLNSIIKRADVGDGRYQYVMKNRIGYRLLNNGQPYGNSKYANGVEIFAVLNQAHVDLVCKKERRAILQDFVDLKNETIQKFNKIILEAKSEIEDVVRISERFIISYKRPRGGSFSNTAMGEVALNHVTLNREDLVLRIGSDTSRLFEGDMISNMTSYSRNRYVTPHNTVVFKLELSMVDNRGTGEEYYVPLISMECGNPRNTDTSAYHHNHKIEGVDPSKIVKRFAEGYTELVAEFEEKLDALRNKHVAEYILSELVLGNTAI